MGGVNTHTHSHKAPICCVKSAFVACLRCLISISCHILKDFCHADSKVHMLHPITESSGSFYPSHSALCPVPCPPASSDIVTVTVSQRLRLLSTFLIAFFCVCVSCQNLVCVCVCVSLSCVSIFVCVCGSCALPALLMCLASTQLQLRAFVMDMGLATRLGRAPPPYSCCCCFCLSSSSSLSSPFSQEALFQFPPFRFSYSPNTSRHAIIV